jgi:hypothetical protein
MTFVRKIVVFLALKAKHPIIFSSIMKNSYCVFESYCFSLLGKSDTGVFCQLCATSKRVISAFIPGRKP